MSVRPVPYSFDLPSNPSIQCTIMMGEQGLYALFDEKIGEQRKRWIVDESQLTPIDKRAFVLLFYPMALSALSSKNGHESSICVREVFQCLAESERCIREGAQCIRESARCVRESAQLRRRLDEEQRVYDAQVIASQQRNLGQIQNSAHQYRWITYILRILVAIGRLIRSAWA